MTTCPAAKDLEHLYTGTHCAVCGEPAPVVPARVTTKPVRVVKLGRKGGKQVKSWR